MKEAARGGWMAAMPSWCMSARLARVKDVLLARFVVQNKLQLAAGGVGTYSLALSGNNFRGCENTAGEVIFRLHCFLLTFTGL